MLFTFFLFWFRSKSADEYKYELKHIHNPHCDEYTVTNKALSIDDNNGFVETKYYLRECKNFESVSIDVSMIPEYAFYASLVKTVTLKSKVLTIGKAAFAFCENLESISFESDASIPEAAFYHSSLRSIKDFPNIISIGAYAFEGCPLNATNFELDFRGKKLETINERAFYGSSLGKIYFSSGMVKIDKEAFRGCLSLTIGDLNIFVDEIKDYAFAECPKITNVNIISHYIYEGAFQCNLDNPTTIASIKQDENKDTSTMYALTIDKYAFYGRTITLEGQQDFSDLTINEFAFAMCRFNKKSGETKYGIKIDNNNKIEIGNNAFYRTKLNSDEKNPFNLIIGKSNGGVNIGYHAFEASTGHLSLTFTHDNEDLITINDYAFYRSGIFNTDLEDENKYLRLVDRFEKIGNKAFAECNLLGGAVFIRNVPIGQYAFYNCKGLKKIVISNCKQIGKGAFEACSGQIENLTITDNRLISNANGAPGTEELVTIEERAFYASGLKCPIVLHSFIDEIGEYAFAYCTNLVNYPITINANTIKPYAFSNCGTFKSPITIHSKKVGFHCFDENTIGDITIGGNINQPSTETGSIDTEAFYDISFTGVVNIEVTTKIKYNAFQLCGFGKNININASIDAYAFANCSCTTTNVVLSIGDTSVGPFAFLRFGDKNTFRLKFIEIKKNTNYIGRYAFYNSTITGIVEIPWCYNAIKNYAFTNCININQVVVNNSNIGNHAFEGCTNLETLTLYSHEDMTTIGSYAFYSLKISSDLIIPRSVTSINNNAFTNCDRIRRLVIEPESALTTIGAEAFANCTEMTGEINIPKTLQTLGAYAFHNCGQLTKLTIFKEDTSLTKIGSYAFCNCVSMDGVLDFPSKIEFIGDYAFYKCSGFKHHITINSACTLGDFSFYECSNIKRVELNLPESSTGDKYIGSYAFAGLKCYNNRHNDNSFDNHPDSNDYSDNLLEENENELIIPSCYYRIGEGAFENSTGFTILIININPTPTTNTGIFNHSFYGSSVSTLVINRDTQSNPNYIVGDYAFANCQNLKRISIDGGIFGDYVFANCPNIEPDDEGFVLYMSGGTLGRHNFDGCPKFGGIVSLENDAKIGESAFENFNLPFALSIDSAASVEIQRRAFYHCSLVEDLDLSGVKTIGSEAFANLPNAMTSLTLNPETAPGKKAFYNTRFANDKGDKIARLTVYSGSKINDKTFEGCRGLNRLTIKRASSYDIPYKAFYGMSDLVGLLTIPSIVVSIGEYAFSGCGFYNIVFEGNNPQIKEGAFSNCRNLNDTINFNSISIIPKRGFYECTNLQSIQFSIPNPVFERSAFEGCSNLNFDIQLPTIKNENFDEEYLYTVHKYAFARCSSLEGTNGQLHIPFYVNLIDDYAFQGCAFTHLEFDLDRSYTKTVTIIGEDDNEKDIEVSVPNELTIGTGAFSGCNKLEYEVNLPDLTGNRIPDRLLQGCSRIQSIDYPDSIHTIGKYAFSGCSGVRGALEIKPNVKRIEEYAFADCSGYSGSLTINVDPENGQTIIGSHAFDGCSGFKKGSLTFFVESDEESQMPLMDNGKSYFRYKYFLRIGAKAFEDTKFSNVYYNGRFQPDCDYDIGFSHTKGIHTSSNYLNKTFCSYPLHKNKLSGGAIAGITIAVIVVVAVIVFLIIFFILKGKKKRDNSEDEVEMNADP